MRLIKTKPRFRCDFCRRTGVQASIERHEKICWRNPNRHCELCDDKGYYYEVHGDLIYDGDGGLSERVECYYCKQYDPTKVPPLPDQPLLKPIKKSKKE